MTFKDRIRTWLGPDPRESAALEAMFRNGVAVGKRLGFDEGMLVGSQQMLENILLSPETYLQRPNSRQVN